MTNHGDLAVKLRNALQQLQNARNSVFHLYSNLENKSIFYNAQNFTETLTNYDKFLISLEKDLKVLKNTYLDVNDFSIVNVCYSIEQIIDLIELQVKELEKLHKLIIQSSSYLRIYRTNRKVNNLKDQFECEIKLIGSKMRFCFEQLNKEL